MLVRTVVTVVVGIALICACDSRSTRAVGVTSPVRTIEFELQPESRETLYLRLRSYADANGLEFAAQTTNTAQMGEFHQFELKGQEIDVIGASVLVSASSEPRFRNGHFEPRNTFSSTRYEVSFYPASSDQQPMPDGAQIAEIEALIGGVEGVTMLEPQRGTPQP